MNIGEFEFINSIWLLASNQYIIDLIRFEHWMSGYVVWARAHSNYGSSTSEKINKYSH